MSPQASATQRANLHKTIWNIANDLRGHVDGWDFKSYVLNMLFYRFASENLVDYLNLQEQEVDPEFDYAQLSDEDAEYGREEVVSEKGFFILPSQLFWNLYNAAENDETYTFTAEDGSKEERKVRDDLNTLLHGVFSSIELSAQGAESEKDIKGLFDDFQVNSPRLGNTLAERNKRLFNLMKAVATMPLDNFQGQDIDMFGDAYEYLMQMYASQAGKSGGEFFTPQEVSEVLARIAVSGKTSVGRVYDPAVGSGSLLLKFAKVLGKENVGGFYGQEINLTTYNLARMNMFLHDIGYEHFDIALGDTLAAPKHWDDEPFEAIVSNPPYSTKWEGKENAVLVNDDRFSAAGVLAPASKADLAFTMHMLSWLAVDGTAAIVEFPGALYRGGAEAKIRKYMVENDFVDAVIQLPSDLFFGTGIATCILVLKRNKKNPDVLFIDASQFFTRVGNKNKLEQQHQDKIVELYEKREAVEYVTALIPNDDVVANGANLSVSSYVEKEDIREEIDMPALTEKLNQLVNEQQALRESINGILAREGVL